MSQEEFILEVGEGTPFANPFKVGDVLDVSWLGKFYRDDYEEYCIYGKPLSPRDCYKLYAKYELRRLYDVPYVAKLLKKATEFRCGCNLGKWCHANVLRMIYLKRDDISSQQISPNVLKRIEGR